MHLLSPGDPLAADVACQLWRCLCKPTGMQRNTLPDIGRKRNPWGWERAPVGPESHSFRAGLGLQPQGKPQLPGLGWCAVSPGLGNRTAFPWQTQSLQHQAMSKATQ